MTGQSRGHFKCAMCDVCYYRRAGTTRAALLGTYPGRGSPNQQAQQGPVSRAGSVGASAQAEEAGNSRGLQQVCCGIRRLHSHWSSTCHCPDMDFPAEHCLTGQVRKRNQ